MGFFDSISNEIVKKNKEVCRTAQRKLDSDYKKAYRNASSDAERERYDRIYSEKQSKIDEARNKISDYESRW